MLTKDELINLISQNSTLSPIIRVAVRDVVADVLELEAKQFIANNQETLENGRQRFVLNGKHPERKLLLPFGPVPVQAPRVRDMKDSEGKEFQSKFLPRFLRKSDDMASLIPWMYLRGLSEKDFSKVFSVIFGNEVKGLSSSTIGQLVNVWIKEYEEWEKRDLSELQYPYLWCDGVFTRVHGESENICHLVVLGVNASGRKDLVGQVEGFSESSDAWKGLFLRLRHQGMTAPKLVVGDGGLGLWAGLSEVFPDCRTQHCWFHKQKDIMRHIPKKAHAQASQMAKEIYISGKRSEAIKQVDLFKATFNKKYPKAVETVVNNLEKLLTFYDFPAEHWAQLRTSNLIESLFSTIRLRAKKTRGQLSRAKTGAMIFKLAQAASLNMRAIPKAELLKPVIAGEKFEDGELVKKEG
jgi:transposase-like protein